MPFDFFTLADHLNQILTQSEADLRLEQAVYGLDSKDEKDLQSLLSAGLKQFYSVAREVHYPSSVGNKRTHRLRCDLVLLEKGIEIKLDSHEPTLFDNPNAQPPTHGVWLEVKVARQFCEGGVRHLGYGSQWRDAVVEDIRKMSTEPKIKDAGLVLIVFTENDQVLGDDLQHFEDVLVRKEVLAGFRQVRSVKILDRIGHHFCSIAIWPTIQR